MPRRRPRVVINVACLRQPLTGVGNYTLNLTAALIRSGEFESVEGITARGHLTEQQLTALVNSLSAPTVENKDSETQVEPNGPAPMPSSLRRAVAKIPYARTLRNHWRDFQARRNQKKFQGAVYWEPNYTLLPLENPAITTIYDLSHLHFPQYHPAERVRLLETDLPASINRAEHIIAISEFTRAELIEHFNVAPERISVVTPSVSAAFRPHSAAEQQQIRTRYGLPSSFVLSLGTLEPRKNLPALIKAYSALPAELRSEHPLVLVGAKGWRDRQIEESLAALSAAEVFRLGYVPQQDLPAIIASAALMVYPSLYEGFGMPILEAMACGVPVLSSNTSAMPEVGREAAVLVNPYNDSDIAEGLFRLLRSPEERLQRARSGLEIAAEYNWDHSAKKLIEVLHLVSTSVE